MSTTLLEDVLDDAQEHKGVVLLDKAAGTQGQT
jgi:hypothetical protein